MVWRGENVVVSKLVSDSRQRHSVEQEQLLSGVTGFSPNTSVPPSARPSSFNSSGLIASFGTSLVRSSTGAYSSENSNPDHQDFPYTDTEVPYGGVGAAKASPKELEERERMVSFKEDTETESGEPVVDNVIIVGGVTAGEAAPPLVQNDEVIGNDDVEEANMGSTNDSPSPSEAPLSPRVAELRAKSKAALKRVEEIGERHTPKNDTDAAPAELGPKHHVRPRRHQHPIEISDDETPSRRLVLRMVDLHLVLSRVNQRILSGLAVSHDDWKLLKEASVDLGIAFGDEVKFKWEQDDDII